MGKYKKEIKHCEKCNKPFSVFPNSTETLCASCKRNNLKEVQKIIRIGDRYWEMVGKFKEEDMTPDEFADYITAKSEQVEKELRERWS